MHMFSYRQFLVCVSLLICLGANFGKASNVNDRFKIKALEPQRGPAGVCNIKALQSISKAQGISCYRTTGYELEPKLTRCRVYKTGGYYQEYLCDRGLWKMTSGTDNHIRQKRGWLSETWKSFNKHLYCLVKEGEWNCEEGGPENLVPPSYTYCPPSGQVYTATSTEKTVLVTWAEPQATDDKGTPSNEQTCCGYNNGDEFPGLPEGRNHTIVYTAKDGHGLSDTCNFWFTVKYITCEPQDPPTNGLKESCTHSNIYGSECTFTCDAGYEMVGSRSSTCQQDKTWSNNPTCQKVLCPAPFAITNGNVTCDDPTYPFDDDCIFTCNNGFKLNGPQKMTCQADQTWSVDETQVICADDEPPEISCLSPQLFYADRGGFSTSVTWAEPTAIDNVDTNPTVAQISGPSQRDVLVEGDHYVIYRSTDGEGNSVPALSDCTIKLEVIVIKCSTGPTDALDVSRFMTYNCSDTSFYNGVSCKLDCDLNLPLNGTDLMTCERDGTTDKGVWSWGSGQQPFCEVVECPAIDPPDNGAFTTDSVSARPLHVMLCQKGYDIPLVGASFSGRLSCQDSGEWYPLDAFPDCIVSRLPLLGLPAELYYQGECNDVATQDQIKQQVLQYLGGVKADIDASICQNADTCKVENVIVVCGSRKRRSLKKHAISKRQVGYALVTFDIMTAFDPGNKTVNDAYVEYLGVLQQMSDQIQADVTNGEVDIAGFALSSDAYQADFSQVTFACDLGSKLDSGVLKCKPCPLGTYLNSSTGNCEQCNVGEYMDHEGAVQCDSCPDSYCTLSTGSKKKQNCIKLCSPGYYSSSTLEPCSACPVGHYQPLQGQTGCESCPTGTVTNTTNSVSIDDCTAFDFSLTRTTLTGSFNADGANVLAMSLWLKLGRGHSSEMLVTITDTHGNILTLNSSGIISVETGSCPAIQTDSFLTADHWTHIKSSVDFGSGTVQLYIDDILVVDKTRRCIDTSRTVQAGEVEIISNSEGVYISGLVIYNRHFSEADLTSLSKTCAVRANDEIFTMTHFLEDIADGTAVLATTMCDPVNACVSEPCGRHICIDMVDGFQCICHWGMTGELCDRPPDYCQGHGCQYGDCIIGNGTYTCSCNSGYTGTFCDKPPVNGGWSQWTLWSGCDVTCGGGSRVRIRNCTNPVPEYMGQDCVGDKMQTESCNGQICYSCSKLNRRYGTVVTCSENPQAKLKECNIKCVRGTVLPNGQKPFEKYWCGESTNYIWMPLDKTPECLVPKTPDRVGALFTIQYPTTISSSNEAYLRSSVEDNLSNVSCVKSDTCDMATSVSTGSRKRRATSSTLTIQFSVQLTNNGDLALVDYLSNGTESSAMTELLSAVSEINGVVEFLQNNTDAIFDVNIGGVEYSIDSSSISVVGTVTCKTGYAGADGLCALCAPGTKLNNPICENCEVGTYQPLYGQSTCLSCPAGYKTETYGATDILECSIKIDFSATTAGINFGEDAKDIVVDRGNAMTIMLATMIAVASVFLMTAIGVLMWRKCIRRKFRQNRTDGSLASLSMVRPSSDNSRSVLICRTAFQNNGVMSSKPPVGISLANKPPIYYNH